MCVACHLYDDPSKIKRRVQFGNWRDTGPIMMVTMKTFAFSIGLRRNRPWFKPDYDDKPFIPYKTLIWGNFILAWRRR